MMEQWKDVSGFENMYQVSNYGRIKSLDRVVKRKVTFHVKGRIMSLCPNSSGYYATVLTHPDGSGKSIVIHQLVALAFLPNPDNFKEVNHKDGDKANNHVDNLEWCDRSYNLKHAYDTGLRKKKLGEDHVRSKFTEADIREIRSLRGKVTNVALGKRYNVHNSQISAIQTRRIWKHII